MTDHDWNIGGRGSRLMDTLGIGAVISLAIAALIVLVAPSIIVLIISFDTRAFVSFPPAGFTFDWYRQVFAQDVLVTAMISSLMVGVAVTLICILLRVPTALACVRGRFRGTTAVSIYVLVAHMVPGILLGVAVLFAGALVGIGPSIGLQSVSIAIFVLAVMVRTIMSRLQRLDPALEEAANLGAMPLAALRTVTFPLLMPAILALAVFTFIEGFDNIYVAIFTHGFRDRPLPIELLAMVQTTNSPLAAAVSGMQILLALLPLFVLLRSIGLDGMNDL